MEVWTKIYHQNGNAAHACDQIEQKAERIDAVRGRIKKLGHIMRTKINEKMIVTEAGALMDSLRQSWSLHKTEFRDEDIENLKIIGRQIKALQEFLEEQQDLRDIDNQEDADEAIEHLHSIAETLKNLAVSKRIQKEIRDLSQRKAQMPSYSEKQASASAATALQKLFNKAPNCPKCGIQMVIREGNETHFWGCQRFPACWGKRRLGKRELDLLPK